MNTVLPGNQKLGIVEVSENDRTRVSASRLPRKS